MRSGPICAVLCCLAVLAAPSVASGAVRHAAPGASGPEPCNPAPCSLVQAVEGAADGDRVIPAPGKYTLTAELELDTAIDVGGEPGAALPTLVFDFDSLRIEHPDAVLHDVRIEMPGPAMAVPLLVEAGRAERVFSFTGEMTGGACGVLAGLLRDSVCWGGFSNGLAVGASGPGSAHVDLINVTANATHFGSSSGAELTVNAVNLLSQGRGATKDVYVDVNTGSSAAITLSHSNFSSVDTSLSAGTDYTYTQPGTNGNQTAEPLFVNAGAGDLHQQAGSPTIDAGISDPLLGGADLDGKPRSQPSCAGGSPIPDIGAYESAPAACAKPSNRFSFGKLKRNKKKGTAKLPVTVPGPGTLTYAGKPKAVSGPGTVKLQ